MQTNRRHSVKSPMHTVGKHLFCFTFLLMFIVTPITFTGATQGTTIKVNPYASTAQIGELIAVNITLTDVENLYGVEVSLHWDASILHVVSVDVRLGLESHSDGVLHEPVFVAKNETIQEEGKYFLAGTSTAPAPPFNGNGNIVRITFNVTNVGDSRLDLETKLSDWPPPDREPRISWPIEHTINNGFFDMNTPTIGIPTRTPSDDVLPEQSVKVSVNVTDSASGVKNVTLLYTLNNGSTWEELVMDYNSSTGFYEATIPAQQAETWVKFKIIAYDYAENLQTKNGEEPYCTYFVIAEFSHTTILLLFVVLTIFAFVLSDKILVEEKLTRYAG